MRPTARFKRLRVRQRTWGMTIAPTQRKASMRRISPKRIAYFVSGHGFGHAARAAAVMAATTSLDPAIQFEIFTDIPSWFFEDSLLSPWRLHEMKTDIGLVQRSPFEEDLATTVGLLIDFVPFHSTTLSRLARRLKKLRCLAVVCDIAPLGIIAARQAGLPSVLVENFTWDFLYTGHQQLVDRCSRQIDYLTKIFRSVDYHIQTQPVCVRNETAVAVDPVSRQQQQSLEEVRQRLTLSANSPMVLVTTGGIPLNYEFLDQLARHKHVSFVLPGTGRNMTRRGNLIQLPHRSGFHHPDLVYASDAVIGKLGYSTLAEAYAAGKPFGYIPRRYSNENQSLESFASANLCTLSIEPDEFITGAWISRIDDILSLPRSTRDRNNGSGQVAAFLTTLVNRDPEAAAPEHRQ
jgi:UDP-N-acetylglucosamine:LPS N-acetylglucosamine transferase